MRQLIRFYPVGGDQKIFASTRLHNYAQSFRAYLGVLSIVAGCSLFAGCVAMRPIQATCDQNLAALVTPRTWDGFVVGGNGCLYHPDKVGKATLSAFQVGGSGQDLTVIFVNGAANSITRQYKKLRRFAQKTGKGFVGVYNDHWIPNKIWLAPSDDNISAEATLVQLIVDQLLHQSSAYVLAGSSGTQIVVSALNGIRDRLIEQFPLHPDRVSQQLQQIQVVTFGGASRFYPDGPEYIHYLNRIDPIPWLFGVGSIGAHPGRNAELVYITQLGPLELNPLSVVHGFQTYLPRMNQLGHLKKF